MPQVDARDEHTARRQRLEELRKLGRDPYPSSSARTHSLGDARAAFDKLAAAETSITAAGRIMALRPHGGSTFVTLDDGTGSLQLYFKQDTVGEQAYGEIALLDVGDIIEVAGTLFATKRGEQTLLAAGAARVLSKALRPLPEKWHGLVDVELRFRKRYLDLLANDAARQAALIRSRLLSAIRAYFDTRGYVEVETPILQAIPGGANAKPFATHLHALDLDLYLRIAPELYLKQLLVAGMPKVYEVARCFRNEGMDHSHNPEFTQIEAYEAYADYEDYMKLVEELLSTVVPAACGSLTVGSGESSIHFTPPFPRLDWTETVSAALDGFDIATCSEDELRTLLTKRGIEVEKHDGRGALLDRAYKKLVRPRLVQPTFLINHPLTLSPLAKRRPGGGETVERFQLVVQGEEIVNGFSELNDPDDQRQRFMEQEQLRARGDDEAQRIDESYLEALEHGLPPAAGLGLGIDRLAALLVGTHNIKEVILFPTLRPRRDT